MKHRITCNPLIPILGILCAALFQLPDIVAAADAPVSDTAVEPHRAPPESVAHWRDWRFGMFLHWGPVSLTAKELSWSRSNTNPKCPNQGETPAAVYDKLYERFDPTNFNATEWVAIAKAAGMKYMVLTAKHCDGFLLWDSKVDDYNIMHTPFKRDVCAELAKAAHEAGMGLGWYYSPMDWRDPDCRNAKNADFVKRMQAELTELLSNYGQIDVLWFDTDGRSAPWDQPHTYALVRKLQPGIVIDERLDMGSEGDYNVKRIGPWADFYTPEQVVGGFDLQRPWESCMTVSRRGQWSWDGDLKETKSFAQCLDMLLGCAGGDGNLLLDVGPMPTGDFAPVQVELIRGMGDWLAKYGNSIYGTRGGPFKPARFGVSTRKGNTIYLHIEHWPGDTLTIRNIPAKILKASVLTGGSITFTQREEQIEISVPAGDRNSLDTVIALELDRPAMELEPVDARLGRSLTMGTKATASNVFQGRAEYGADKACDGDSETRWATDDGTTNAWLEVDLGKQQIVGRVIIEQAYPELKRVKKFAIQYWADDQWKVCYTGENLGGTLDATFAPVTAQRVRLNITEASDGPTIWEFQLYAPPASR